MGTNEKIRDLNRRLKATDETVMKLRVQLNEVATAMANNSVVAIELVTVLGILKKKGVITDVEIQTAYKEAKASNGNHGPESSQQPEVQSEGAGSVGSGDGSS